MFCGKWGEENGDVAPFVRSPAGRRFSNIARGRPMVSPTSLCVGVLCVGDTTHPPTTLVPPPSQGRDYCNPFFSQQTERFRKFQTKVKFYRLLKKAKTLFVPPQ